MKQLKQLIILAIFSCLLSSSPLFSLVSAQSVSVPPNFQGLYSTLQGSLNNFNVYLNAQGSVNGYPTVLATELLPANGNRGTDLLTPQALQGSILSLNRFQELGIQGVTIAIGYPLYTSGFPNYSDYVAFFKQVVQAAKDRGMKVDIESAVSFANTPYSPLQTNYAGLTLAQYEAQRKQMITSIIQDLHPDYLNLGSEPDTEAHLLSLGGAPKDLGQQIDQPQTRATYINYILNGLDRQGTKLGSGVGTWDTQASAFLNALDNISLDTINLHVYPLMGQNLQNLITLSNTAEQSGKRVLLDEAWLYKADQSTVSSGNEALTITQLDTYSFWAPLDQEFLSTMVKASQVAKIDYVSPFWSTYFFSYINYDSNSVQLSYQQSVQMVNQAASQNIQADQFSSTGQFYEQLIKSTPTPEFGSIAILTFLALGAVLCMLRRTSCSRELGSNQSKAKKQV